jgi:hypothetical protein
VPFPTTAPNQQANNRLALRIARIGRYSQLLKPEQGANRPSVGPLRRFSMVQVNVQVDSTPWSFLGLPETTDEDQFV